MRLRYTRAPIALLLATRVVFAGDTVPVPDLSGAAEPVREALTASANRMSELLDRTDDADTVAAGWIDVGDDYFAHDFYAEALQAYDAARALVGDRPALAYRIGLGHMAEGRLQQGVDAYTAAVNLADDALRMPALVRRGRALLDLGQTDASLADFREAVRLAPDSAAALGGLGRAELESGDAEAALQHLRRALQLDPAATRLRQPLGMAYRRLGDREGARAALAGVGEGEPALFDPVLAAINRRSRSPQFFLQAGLVQADRGAFEAAAELIGRAVSLAPDDLSLVSTYGQVLAEAGQYELARKALERVTASDTATVDDWLYLGGVEQARGRFEQAEAAFQKVLAFESGNATARESLARLALHRGAFEEARAAFEALADATRAPEARGRLLYWAGMSGLGAGDCEGALEHLEAARTAGLASAPALLQALARARATCPGTPRAAVEEALAWSEQTYQSAPGLETSATLAMVYAALDRFTDAVDLQAQAMFEALKTTGLDARPGLQVDMARYRERRRAERAYRAADPLFRLD